MFFRVCKKQHDSPKYLGLQTNEKFKEYLRQKLQVKDDVNLYLSFSSPITACNNSQRYPSKERVIETFADTYTFGVSITELDKELDFFKDGEIMKIKRLAFNDTLEEHEFCVHLVNAYDKNFAASVCR